MSLYIYIYIKALPSKSRRSWSVCDSLFVAACNVTVRFPNVGNMSEYTVPE